MPEGSASFELDRRRALGLAAAMVAASGAQAAEPAPAGGPLAPDVPIVTPRTEFVYEALVELDRGVLDMGKGPLGPRRIVPITGGRFEGPKLKGTVLNGGADRQLLRADGARLLHALYELKTDDGALITVDNRVLITKRPDGSPYKFSQIDIIAPEGPHGWLNHLTFVGDLHSDPAKPKVVLIRVYALT